MIDAFLKLIPLTTVLAGGAMNKDVLQAQISRFTDLAKVAAVQQEVNSIAKMVYMDTLDNTAPTPDQFSEWVRRNMKNKIGMTRDTSLDFWGHPYKLKMDRSQIVVRSAGPDGRLDNEDDVFSGYTL